MKFSGYYKNAQSLLNEQRQRSGSTSWDGQSHLSLTHKLYEDAEQAKFPYYQCWLMLRDQPKWSVDFTSLGKSDQKGIFKSPTSWSASRSSQSSCKSTPDDSGRQQRDDSPMLDNQTRCRSSRTDGSAHHFGGGSNRTFVAGGAANVTTDDSGRQQRDDSPMLDNQTRYGSSRTDGSTHHFGGGSNRNCFACLSSLSTNARIADASPSVGSILPATPFALAGLADLLGLLAAGKPDSLERFLCSW